MELKLHVNAGTTSAIRRYIQESHKSVKEMCLELGIGETTVRKKKGRLLSYTQTQKADTVQVFEPLDLKHLTKLQSKAAYVFVAIERHTRFV